MTSYNKFNKWVCEYYINNCITHQLNSLSIPISEIDEFINEYDIKLDGFKEINCNSWYYLIKEKEDIPQYFGLIALQCLAAFKMQNINDRNAGNFRDHFAELIGINDVNKISVFFAESYDDKFKVQEKIWFGAKEFLGRKNILLDIPEIGENAGRYTRFPKSQIVLNQEDLKEYKSFFISIHSVFESISFEDFKKHYLNKISNFKNDFRRENNTKNDNQWSDIERRIKIKQIFDFYCSEEWFNIHERTRLIDKIHKNNYILKFSSNELLLFDEYHNRLDNLNSLIKINKFLLFKENKHYPNEFESVSMISIDDNNIILIYNSPSNSNEIKVLQRDFLQIEYKNLENNILIFKIINSENLPDFFINKIISEYPIELRGFKVSGKKKYFVNHPPTLFSYNNISYQIYFDKKRISKNEMNKVGKYFIKVNGHSNYNFELIDIPVLDYPSNNLTKSLIFKSLNYEIEDKEICSINGLKINSANQIFSEPLTINNWIKTINGSKTTSDNLLLKSISQKSYGKY